MIPDLELLLASGRVAASDRWLALGLGRAAREEREEVLAAVALLAHSVSDGDVCLELQKEE